MRRLANAGFGWVRLRVDWNLAEPAPGAYQWAWTDEILEEIAAVGLEPVVVLDGSPTWARADRDRPGENDARNADASFLPPQFARFAPPADPGTFARFAAAFAVRYQDTVRFYQIWEEPNIAPHWGNRLIDPFGYARLLQAAATAVRAADADAVILAAALAPTQDRGHTAIDEGYFLQRLYAAGAAPYFDAVLIQPFGFGTAPGDERSRVDVLNFRRAAWVRRVMVSAGDEETPIWAVRFGWNRQIQDQWKTVSATNQLRFATEAVRRSQANWPWLAAMGWPVDRPDALASDPMWGFALVASNGREHPLLTTLPSAVLGQVDKAEYANAGTALFGLYARLALLFVAFGTLAWAGATMAGRLPLAGWQAAYRRWPQRRKVVLWTLLLIAYFLSVWPPFILLCWIGAAFLIAAEPLTGLVVVAAALPFHFQHKEVRLGGTIWAVAPAQAALLAMLPALARQLTSSARIAQPLRLVAFLRMNSPIRLARQATGNLRYADFLVLSWIAVSLLSGLNVWRWPAYVGGLWTLVVAPALLYAALRMFAIGPGQRRMALGALFAGGVLAAVAGIADWLGGGGVSADGVRRLMGVSFSPNQTALYLLRTLFAGAGIMAVGGRRRYGSISGCLLVAAALLLTSSRGALLFGLPAARWSWRGKGARMNSS